jgi:hypothetical protein
MIKCPVCFADNHHLAIICKSCGAFLQNKIEALDLFLTAWRVFEQPSRTFHAISISRHKNYVIFLSSVAGIGFTFTFFWLINAGGLTNSLLRFLGTGILIGPPLGIITVAIFSIICIILARFLRTKMSFNNCYAVTAYALIPTVVSVILVLPLEIMTFGLYFFSKNPSPYLLKPTIYILLLILDGIFAVWTLILIEIGIKKLTDRGHLVAIFIMIIGIGAVVGIYSIVYSFLFPYIHVPSIN